MTVSAFDRYLELLGKVDAFSHLVVEANRGDIACRNGCDECCRKSFTVFQVEARNLHSGFLRLDQSMRRLITSRCVDDVQRRSSCVLLEACSCMLYDYRPIICRTHGLPLISENLSVNGESKVTLCEKNFTARGSLSRLPAEHILDLDRLNTVLSAVNMLYLKETAGAGLIPAPGERIGMPEIFRD